jgi:PAS domain S-box-containing protein
MRETPRARLVTYGVAVLATAVSLLVRWPLWPVLGNRVAHMTFFPAVVLAAYFGGFWPGLLATILSAVAASYFITEQLRYGQITSANDVTGLILFVLIGTIISGLGENRKRAEVALRERASLLDLTHDSIFVRDMSDVITYWNRGAEELYGWTREEAVGKVSHQLTRTTFPAPLEEIDAELLSTGRWEGELIHTRRDGTQVVVASRWSLERNKQGQPAAILETNNDITERKRAEDGLQKAQTELAHLTRVMTMGELAASIAHEVNQPLTAVITNAHACSRWLSGQRPNFDEAREAVGRIVRDGNRASEVIQRIRSLLKKTAPQKSPLDINEVIREVIALTAGELRRKSVYLKTDLAENLAPVFADRVQLQQVVLNLIINGVEAMGTVTGRSRDLLVRAQRDELGGVTVSVQDSGDGIDPQNIERLFDAFYTTKAEGMGMGLSVSRSIIEAHGGRLWAASDGGHGATIQFTLPADEGNRHD